MTREEAKELLPIMQAYAEGKTIQFLDGGKWADVYQTDFYQSPGKYRIKPEPKYRPFRTRRECWDEMLKHQPFGWLKSKENEFCINIGEVSWKEGYGENIEEQRPKAFRQYNAPCGESYTFGVKIIMPKKKKKRKR